MELDNNTVEQCKRAIKLFNEGQILVAVEEMSELTQVLLKYVNRNRREPEDLKKVIDECSDVLITMFQVLEILGIYEEVKNHIPEKGERLRQKLNRYEFNKNTKETSDQ